MKGNTKVALGIIGALAAGVTLGLLLAPEKGSETRKRIKKTAGDLADQLGGAWAKGKEWVEDVEENSKKIKNSIEEKLKRSKENVA